MLSSPPFSINKHTAAVLHLMKQVDCTNSTCTVGLNKWNQHLTANVSIMYARGNVKKCFLRYSLLSGLDGTPNSKVDFCAWSEAWDCGSCAQLLSSTSQWVAHIDKTSTLAPHVQKFCFHLFVARALNKQNLPLACSYCKTKCPARGQNN